MDQDKPVEAGQVPENVDVSALIAKEVAKATEGLQEQYKKELAGLNRANSELQEKAKTATEDADAERRAKMSDEEKWREEMDAERAESRKFRRELQISQNRETARQILQEKGIPQSMLDFVKLDDAESMTASIEKLAASVGELRKASSEDALKSVGANAPATTVADGTNTMKMEAFQQMLPTEQMKFVKEGGLVID